MHNRTTLATAVLLAAAGLLTACGNSDDGGGSKPTTPATTATPTHTTPPPATTPVPVTTPPTTAATPTDTPTTAAAKKAKAKPKATDCMPARDVYVWVKSDGVPAMAEALGDYSNCGRQSTFDMVRDTSPTGPGNCTEAAWASDNPGYNPDADPAKRLKHVQVSIGPAC